jgi:hypothetical protein
MSGPTRAKNDETPDCTLTLVRGIMVDTFRSPAISALVAGLCLGILSEPDTVFKSFYEPLFRGLLSILMLIMGMKAWARFAGLRKVAHAYILYGITAPIIHGLMGFGVGLLSPLRLQNSWMAVSSYSRSWRLPVRTSPVHPQCAQHCQRRTHPPLSEHRRGWALQLPFSASLCSCP